MLVSDELCSDVTCVERASDGWVRRTFQYCAAIAKDGHLVRWDTKFQQKVVFLYRDACDGKLSGKRGKIERAPALVNLHRIAAAQCDMWLRFSFQVGMFTANAVAAVRVASDCDGLHSAAPNVAGQETIVQRFRTAGQNF